MSWELASGIMLLIGILMFFGIVAWAYSARRKNDFEEAARLAVDDFEPEEKT